MTATGTTSSVEEGREVTKPAPRTEAQREASRRNGRKSKGPRTVAGKARSRQNSMKHGLYAKTITPSTDVRNDDQLFQVALKELTRELSPSTFTEHAKVTSLAHDYVQLTRARRLLELLQDPFKLDKMIDDRAEACRKHALRQRELQLVDEMIQEIGQREPPCLEPDDARKVASLVTRQIARLESQVAQWDKEHSAIQPKEERSVLDAFMEKHVDSPDAGGDTEEYHAAEVERIEEDRKLVQLANEGRARIKDEDWLTTFFSGDRVLTQTAALRILQLLHRVRGYLGVALTSTESAHRAMSEAFDDILLDLAKSPDALVRINELVERLEKRIDRGLDKLQGS